MFNIFKTQKQRIEELELKVKELEKDVLYIKERNSSFLGYAEQVAKLALKNDKKNFAYLLQKEDMMLMNDGRKFRKITGIFKDTEGKK